MAKQLKSFNQKKAGNVKGYCLRNTRLGFGVGPKWEDAWGAWLNTDQHFDAIPDGVDVPVYFWYKDENNGHVGVRLANGQFWTDGAIYPSVAAYDYQKAPDYRGWSTSINGVQVIDVTQETVRIRVKPVTWNIRTGAGIEFGKTGSVVRGGQEYNAIIQPNGWAHVEQVGGYIASNSYERI